MIFKSLSYIKKALSLTLRGHGDYVAYRLKRGLRGSGVAQVETVFADLSNQERERVQALALQQRAGFEKSSSYALAMHVFYPEIFLQTVVPLLQNFSLPLDIHLSVAPHIGRDFYDQVLTLYPKAQFYLYENKGRDQLPFLRMLVDPQLEGYEWICKLHTKKSPTYSQGEAWARDLIGPLLSEKSALLLKSAPKDLGLIAPPLSYLPVDLFMGGNRGHMENVLRLIGKTSKFDFYFVAGSMFWVRPEALRVLKSKVSILSEQFPVESGAIDGTMPHAMERLLAFSATQAGFTTREINKV